MVSANIVNALVAWAGTDAARILQITNERDAAVAAILSGGKPTISLTSASVNGKSFTGLEKLGTDDKLTVLTAVLEALGVIDPQPRVVHSNFSQILR